MDARWRWVALHSAGAAAFFFALQYLGWKQSVETSLIWAAAGAVGAAMLAWSQTRR